MQAQDKASVPGIMPQGYGGDGYGTKIEGLTRKDADYDKVDKAAVHFRRSASGERCDTCQFSTFPPGSGEGVCKWVKGVIYDHAVCDLYQGFAVTSANHNVRNKDMTDIRATIASLDLDSLCLIEYARKFTAEQRQNLAKQGKALPDGSFPIENRGDLKNAVRAFGRSGNKSAAKAHIKKMAKSLGAEDLLPENWSSADNE